MYIRYPSECIQIKKLRERNLPVAKSCQVEEPYREEEGPSQEGDIDYYYCCTVLPAAAALGAAAVVLGPTWFCGGEVCGEVDTYLSTILT